MGILVSNSPEQSGKNRVECNYVEDIYSQGNKVLSPEEVSRDLTAESYGIVGISNAHEIVGNHVEQVDSKGSVIDFAVGIRAVDHKHIISDNISRNHGYRSAEPDSPKFGSVIGLSIDASNTKVERNQIVNNNGIGILASSISKDNHILDNVSRFNYNYDYMERPQPELSECRNKWENNWLIDTHYDPVNCFI